MATGCSDTSNVNQTVPSGSVYCDVGDTLELQGRHIGQNLLGCDPYVTTAFGYDSDSVLEGAVQPSMTITYSDAVASIGSTVSPNNILPCGVSQTDYIKSISQLFNLYFATDIQRKVVYIEPFNDFFKSTSDSINWGEKLDFSQPIEDSYDVGLTRELNIGYKVDGGDKFMEARNDEVNVYGETNKLYNYREILGLDYLPGNTDIINPVFAATTQVWDNDVYDNPANDPWMNPALIPNLWTGDYWAGIGLGNNQQRPSDIIEPFVPRIFYFNYEQSFVSGAFPNAPNIAAANMTFWSRINSAGVAIPTDSVYPRATFVDWDERAHFMTNRPSLSFNDEEFTAPGQSGPNHVPGLYTMYYKNMIEQLKKSPRIRTVYVNLKISDILNLDMRKLIYLDDNYWRINKIVGFSPANNNATKVELIQWLEVGAWPVYGMDDSPIKYK